MRFAGRDGFDFALLPFALAAMISPFVDRWDSRRTEAPNPTASGSGDLPSKGATAALPRAAYRMTVPRQASGASAPQTTLRAPNRMRRGRVVTRMRWIQGRATVIYLYGMSRSYDAVDAHSRHNPQGRASFAASRRGPRRTARRRGAPALLVLDGAPSPASPSRLGLRQNTLRRGASHSVSGSKSQHCGQRGQEEYELQPQRRHCGAAPLVAQAGRQSADARNGDENTATDKRPVTHLRGHPEYAAALKDVREDETRQSDTHWMAGGNISPCKPLVWFGCDGILRTG